jgi:formylmethanofuran dehydrogenase subunit D
MNYRKFSLGATALALLVVSAPAFADKKAENPTHDGKVVSITGSTLVMTIKGDKDAKEHSHTLADDAKVTLDGKACKAEDLKAGTKVRVTTKAGEPKIAIAIEAIDKNETFANTHDGKVVTITETKLVMTDKDGKEHSHAISTKAKVTLDGKDCKTEDLKAGFKIRVTTRNSEKGVVIEIEAIDKNADFA